MEKELNARNSATCTHQKARKTTHGMDGQHQDVQSEWQRTEINGESTSMVWPTLGSRTAKEQNRTEHKPTQALLNACRHPNNTTYSACCSAQCHGEFCEKVCTNRDLPDGFVRAENCWRARICVRSVNVVRHCHWIRLQRKRASSGEARNSQWRGVEPFRQVGQGRLNQWAHWACTCQGPRIVFILLRGPQLAVVKYNYLITFGKINCNGNPVNTF